MPNYAENAPESGKEIEISWDPRRIAALSARVNDVNEPEFVRLGARGQLAAADGDLKSGERELFEMILKFGEYYPDNKHFFSHIMQLAVSIKNAEIIGFILNRHFHTSDLFSVHFESVLSDYSCNQVTVSQTGQCQLALDPGLIGSVAADHHIQRWMSSGPLWASYCQGENWMPGSTMMNSGDAPALPGLAYCGANSDCFLVPDPYFLLSNGYSDLQSRFAMKRRPWNERQPIAFWRGANSGQRFQDTSWDSLPRIILCKLSQANNTILDARISWIAQFWSEQEFREIEQSGLVSGSVPEERFLDFKYQIDIDGNTNSWPGFYLKLLTGSPVLKVASPHNYRQWYYDRLRPWEHYVPVASDLSDLKDAIHWLQTHDDKAREIGAAGEQFALSLRYDDEIRMAGASIRSAFASGITLP